MKRTLFIGLILSIMQGPANSEQLDFLSVDDEFIMLEDKDAELSNENTCFTHTIGELHSGTQGGTLNIMYDGLNAEAKSVITIGSLTGTGDLELQGSSTNTLKLFRLVDNAASGFQGNLTLSNYSAAWDGARLHDNVTVLETGDMRMSGSITLDVAGYCTTDTYFVAALGLGGDLSIGGLDAAEYIAPAAFLYSGTMMEGISSIKHSKELSDYITPAAHTLTIDTDGTHHFHGSIVGGLTIVKKGSGSQSFTGDLGKACHFQALGGTLQLTGNTHSASITIEGGTLQNTGNLGTGSLQMQAGTLTVSGTLNAPGAEFRGSSMVAATSLTGTTWTLHLQQEHRETAVLELNATTTGCIETLQLDYNKSKLPRGWYHLVENASSVTITRILCGNNPAATKEEEGTLMFYLADGELTFPRTNAAELVWQPASGTWKTGSGHVEQNWAGPDTNSNFLNGDRVTFRHAAEITLEGELLPTEVRVCNTAGCVSFTGSGSIGGAATLLKTGTGSLSIGGSHTFTGGTTLEEGELITTHAGALGTGVVQLRGGRLNLHNQPVNNGILVQGDAEIAGGSEYAGELVMQSGCLRGDTLKLTCTAQLKGGEIALQLTGSGGIRVQGNVLMSSAGNYSGATTVSSGTLTTGHAQALGSSTVILSGGSLDLNHQSLSNTLHVQGESRLLNAGNFCGPLDLQSGHLTTAQLGDARLSCSGSATLQAEGTLHLTGTIHNTGILNMAGTFNLTALAESTAPVMVDAFGTTGGSSGFQRDSGTRINLFTGGGQLGGDARFLFRGEEISLDSQGRWATGANTHYGQYHIATGHQVAVSRIRAAAGNALKIITMNGGQLTADADATVTTEGGAHILLTGGSLSGNCSDTSITATGGTLGVAFSGNSCISSTAGVKLAGCISNAGSLTLQGEIDATALPLTEQAATRTRGTSSASGFARTAAYSVQVVNGGSVNAGATIIHGDKRLSLGSDGRATAGGSVDYNEYLLTGNDTARLSAIQRPELKRILVNGGTFTVDGDTAAMQTSGGTVLLESGTISCPLSGCTELSVTGAGRLTAANTHTGGTLLNGGELTITTPDALDMETFRATGSSTLRAEGFTLELTTPIRNEGHLLLSGSFDATALAESREATMVDAFGNEGGSSGFVRDAGTELQLTTGGTLNSSDASILLHGQPVFPDASGHASLPGALHRDTYRITGEHSVSVSDIMQAAGNSLQHIHMDSGTLLVDTDTDALSATGGLVRMSNAILGGSMSGSTQVEVLGYAVLCGKNSHSGGTTVTTGSLRLEHAQALGSGAVHLGSRGRNSAPRLDMANLPVSNHLVLGGSSVLVGLENFSGSITMQEGAETTIAPGDVLNLSKGQTLTVAPGGNTIHGHVNLNGGTIVLTGGPLTLHGVAHFSGSLTLDLSQQENLNPELLVLNFPSAFDKERINIVLTEDKQDKELLFDPETGKLTVEINPGNTPPATTPSLANKLNRNQRKAYEALRRLSPEAVSGELRELVNTVNDSTDAAAMRELMNRVNGSGYTALPNSVADDALAQLQHLRNLAGRAPKLSPDRKTAVLIHAFNNTSSASAQEQGYDRSCWGGRLMVEQQVSEQLCLGFAMANGQTRITPVSDEEHSDTATHLSGYALYSGKNWRFTLAAGVSMHEFSLSRRLHNGHSCEVDAVSGNSVNVCAEIARRLKLSQESTISPYFALQSTTAKVDSFSENGGTAALQVDSQQATLTELSLGARYETTLAQNLQLELEGALTATLGDTETEADMSFAESPEQQFQVYADKRDTLGTELGLSLMLPLQQNLSLHADANLKLSQNAYYLSSQLGVILHF